jgi:micrococcal nuclease
MAHLITNTSEVIVKKTLKKILTMSISVMVLTMSLSTGHAEDAIPQTADQWNQSQIVEKYVSKYEAEKGNDLELYNPFVPKDSKVIQIDKSNITVHDGDTIKYDTKKEAGKIRLIGIDAPELKQEDGLLARDCLLNLINEDGILFAEMFEADRYGRTLGRLILSEPDGKFKDIDKAMLVRGCAWHYSVTRYLGKEENKVYQELFTNAQHNKTGIFETAGDILPGDYRHKKL